MSSRAASGLVLAALAASGPTFAADCPASNVLVPFTAHYDVIASRSVLTLEGEATIEFRRNGNDYTLTASMNAAGLLSSRQESHGAIGDGLLIPVRYGESNNRRGAASTTIDWRARRVTFADGPEEPPPALLQDRASLMVQLALSLRARPETAAMEFPVASLRRINTFKFVRRATERLELPAGAISADRFERVDDNGDDRLEVWLAASHCTVPVRIRLRDHRGNDIDQRLRGVKYE